MNNIHNQQVMHQGEIWTSSQCLANENLVLDTITTRLQSKGFTSNDQKLWHRGRQKVIVRLVDDIISCSSNYDIDTPYLFDKDTLVISDNYIICPTQYQVMRLPAEFFGIYSHTPSDMSWNPDRNFCFSVNRIDIRRIKLMLEIARRNPIYKGYINFNCYYETALHQIPIIENQVKNFTNFYQALSEQDQKFWEESYLTLLPSMPLKNYELTHEQIHTRSWINIVVESYGSDNSIALSEKIFRVLTLPVPWTAYLGRYGVAYLESIGFDCMGELIDHNHYDRLKEVENKNGIFVWKSFEIMKELRNRGLDQISDRCLTAARHNQQLLKQFRQQWPDKFKQWLVQFDQAL
jgi:hypothetical protein